LAVLAEHEIADRDRRRIERHLAEARLPVGKTLASFDFDAVPMLSKAQVMALWTAGVAPSPILKLLNAKADRAGRVVVGPFMNVPEHSAVFVVGDAASVQRRRPVPGLAQAAIQEGRYVGRLIARQLKGYEARRPFEYSDKGSMAVVGKNFAVLQGGRLRLTGFVTWVVWAVVHIISLPQAQNKWRVRIQWLWSYFTGQRSSRLIPERGQ
jgi:NADH dehydrogenase